MSRHSLVIRDAGPQDADALLALWTQYSPRGEHPSPRPLEEAAAALAQTAADPDERFLVGVHDGVIVAALHLRRAVISPLHSDMAIHTSYLLVLPEFRKHGYARALLDAAVGWAEEKDVALVSSYTAGSSRDNQQVPGSARVRAGRDGPDGEYGDAAPQAHPGVDASARCAEQPGPGPGRAPRTASPARRVRSVPCRGIDQGAGDP